jgi:aminocarboxymuconate-semialdehyde decarboxylase
LRRFWYDTITHASAPLAFLVDLIGADRVMFGSDLPFDMADIHFQRYFAEAAFDRTVLDAIAGGTAAALFGLERAAAARRA